jgi:hypothetical protein
MYNKNCPKCNIIISYSTKYTLAKAIEKNTECKKCAAETAGTIFSIGHKKANKHSQSYTKEYRLVSSIIQRCYNKKMKRYSDYGGRGIEVFQEWLGNKILFVEYLRTLENYDKWVLNSKLWQIDRINNDGNYEPNNIRFANVNTQSFNKRIRNKNGCPGVYYDGKKYFLRIGKVYIGCYDTLEECINIRTENLKNVL